MTAAGSAINFASENVASVADIFVSSASLLSALLPLALIVGSRGVVGRFPQGILKEHLLKLGFGLGALYNTSKRLVLRFEKL